MSSAVSYIKRDPKNKEASIGEGTTAKATDQSLSFNVPNTDKNYVSGNKSPLAGTSVPLGAVYVNPSTGEYYEFNKMNRNGTKKLYKRFNKDGIVTAETISENTIKQLVKNKTVSPLQGDKFTSVRDYATDKNIGSETLDDIIEKLNKTVFLPPRNETYLSAFEQTVKYYNRFKVANPNLYLQKGFGHIFFVRPSCNIIGTDGNITPSLKNNEVFSYVNQSAPIILKELSKKGCREDDFMLSISNAVASFSLNDEYINSDSYGKTYTGYKISYGKHSIESKTAGSFNVTFKDDRNLHIYQLHRLWVEYIDGVFRGNFAPDPDDIFNKILDYCGACYYIMTAEDGETILFWSKYYGVFPTTIPSTQYSWTEGSPITNPQLDISYNYSFKEDFNPYTILEFNYNANAETNSGTYVPVYDKELGHVGKTWVGVPFIELVKNDSGLYYYKLRFKKP